MCRNLQRQQYKYRDKFSENIHFGSFNKIIRVIYFQTRQLSKSYFYSLPEK
jgi:hypothetical protein